MRCADTRATLVSTRQERLQPRPPTLSTRVAKHNLLARTRSMQALAVLLARASEMIRSGDRNGLVATCTDCKLWLAGRRAPLCQDHDRLSSPRFPSREGSADS